MVPDFTNGVSERIIGLRKYLYFYIYFQTLIYKLALIICLAIVVLHIHKLYSIFWSTWNKLIVIIIIIITIIIMIIIIIITTIIIIIIIITIIINPRKLLSSGMFLGASSKLIWWYRDLRWTFKNTSSSHFEYCFLYCGYCVRHSFTAVFHCAESGRIRSYSSPYFSTFKVHTKGSLRVQSEGGKIRTKPLFTTVNHVRFSTVYNVIKSANSGYHIRWVFPF